MLRKNLKAPIFFKKISSYLYWNMVRQFNQIEQLAINFFLNLCNLSSSLRNKIKIIYAMVTTFRWKKDVKLIYHW